MSDSSVNDGRSAAQSNILRLDFKPIEGLIAGATQRRHQTAQTDNRANDPEQKTFHQNIPPYEAGILAFLLGPATLKKASIGR